MSRKKQSKGTTLPQRSVAIEVSKDSWRAFAERFSWTAREVQIAQLLFEEHLEKQIARTLKIKESTLHTHVHHIYEKMGVHSRAGFSHVIFNLFLQFSRSRDESPPPP